MKATVMRSSIVLCMLLVYTAVYAGPIGVEHPGKPSPPKTNAVAAPGVVIVMLKAGVPYYNTGVSLGVSELDNILARIHTNKIKSFYTKKVLYKGENQAAQRLMRMFRIDFSSPEESYALCEELKAIASVEFAEPYLWFYPEYTPNDPRLNNQWAIDNMNLEEAWEYTKGDPDVAIAIVDSGIKHDHEDLAGNIFTNMGEWGTSGELSNNGIDDDGNGYIDDYRGWDFGNSDNDPMDVGIYSGGVLHYHGTMAAGCASAVTDNGIGIASPGYSCSLIPVKAVANGNSGITYGYEGITYAADVGAKVISCSWGSVSYRSPALQAIVDYATENGALVVASAGNEPIDNDTAAHYPSSYDDVLSVGSVESSGNFSTWSTFGSTIDVYAPGSGILTTNGTGTTAYTTTQGTSFSCPYTAGVAGLLFSLHPDWTPQQVAKEIRVTAHRFATNDPKRFGRVDAEAALANNATFGDVPGMVIEKVVYAVRDSQLTFEKPGTTTTFTVTLRNILGQSSDNAQVMVEFEDDFLTSSTGWQVIGVVAHDATVDVTFEVELSSTAQILSHDETYLYRIRVQDGANIDFVTGRLEIYLQDAWHRVEYNYRPTYSSIDIVNENVIWAASHVETTVGDETTVEEDAFVSTDGGATWTDANEGAGINGWPSQTSRKGLYCICGVDENTALFGMGNATMSAIYRTTNQGGSWTGAMATARTSFINWIHMFDADNGIYQGDPKYGTYGIGYTTNGGQSWAAIPNSVSAETDEMSWNNSYDVIGDHMWFGTNNYKVYHSTDKGMSWTSASTTLKNSVGVSFRDENIGIARFSQQDSAVALDQSGLEITTDGGATWASLTTITINAGGAVEFEKGGDRLFVMNNYNSYVSTDLGTSWSLTPIPSVFYVSSSDLYVDKANNKTLVVAGGAYLFTYVSDWQEVVSVHPVSSADGFSIDAVYPNPASAQMADGVTVDFTLPTTGATQLQVYDYIGRLIATPVEATLTAGTQSAFVSFGTLPAGVYFLKLYHNNSVQVQKVTVTR